MAQATRNELSRKQQQQQQQQVCATSIKTKVTRTTKPDESATATNATTTTTTSTAASTTSTTNKTKPSYKHIPHSQKPPHLVAKRNARERRRVQAVNQAFYKLRKCVPIQNRNKRVSKVKTLQRAIDYIRDLEAVLAQDDAAQAGGQEAPSGRIFVSSQAGDEAEMRLAMSPEPTKRAQRACDQKSGSEARQVDKGGQQERQTQPVKQRRGRKPNAVKQQEAALKRGGAAASVTTAPRAAALEPLTPQDEFLISSQAPSILQASYSPQTTSNSYGRLPLEATLDGPSHYYSSPQATCHTTTATTTTSTSSSSSSGTTSASVYAYQTEPHNEPHYRLAYSSEQQPHQQHQHQNQHHHHHHDQHQHHHLQPHYYQPFHERQYQQPQQAYSGQQQFYSPNHQVPYGDADSSSSHRLVCVGGERQLHEQQQQQQQQQNLHESWQQQQPALARPTAVSSTGHENFAQLNSSPSNSANLTQLTCNLDSSASSSSSSSGSSSARSSGNATCLFNGRRVTSMPADSTSSSTSASSSAGNNINKSASSLIGSPYSTGSSVSCASSSSAGSASFGSNGPATGNKSLDLSAPLDLKSDKLAASAGSRQVNNYAGYSHAPPPPPPQPQPQPQTTCFYGQEARSLQQQPDGTAAKLIGQQESHKSSSALVLHQMGQSNGAPIQLTTSFACGIIDGGAQTSGDLYLANNPLDSRQPSYNSSSTGYHQTPPPLPTRVYANNANYHHTHLMSEPSLQVASRQHGGAYNAPLL